MKKSISFFTFFFLLFVVSSAQPQSNEEKLAEQYFLDKEYESALEFYGKLYARESKSQFVTRILTCYEQLKKFNEGIVFMDKAIQKEPYNFVYPAMKAATLEKIGKDEEAKTIYETLNNQLKNESDFIQVGVFLVKTGKLEEAEQTYLMGRKKLRNDAIFAPELATIYDQQGMYEKATGEYINQYYNDRESYGLVNLSILNMVGNAGANDAIEKVLLKEAELNAGDLGIRQTIFEFYVLKKDFQEAFLQVKAIDKFFYEDGEGVFRFAETMRNSKNYDLSNKSYDYIINNKPSSPYYFMSFIEKATNGELRAFEQVPPDMTAIQEAVAAYGELIQKFGKQQQYFNAIYRRANLQVFYLNQLDEPKADLEEITATQPQGRGMSKEDWAKGRLLIGDIMVMKKDYNNAKLLYTNLAEQFKDRQTGAMAKFRLGQMAYYRGEFDMAQSILATIKDNTSNDISNDAIQLNLKIIDNTGLDSTTKALAMFSQAELLVYQRNFDEANTLMDSLAYKYPTHSLADEIYWTKANICLKKNEIPQALELLNRILDKYKEDIYADDALFTKARLYDYNLKDSENAMKYYMEMLSAYPGSLYIVEVRKRIRELRNDKKEGM
ncbi:MAG: tetratricopeptide repeat protein [Bacteroidia bacterium]